MYVCTCCFVNLTRHEQTVYSVRVFTMYIDTPAASIHDVLLLFVLQSLPPFLPTQDKRGYLDVISRYFDVHATIGDTTQKKQDYDMSIVPGFVFNHGILKAPDLQALLRVGSCLMYMLYMYSSPWYNN